MATFAFSPFPVNLIYITGCVCVCVCVIMRVGGWLILRLRFQCIG